MKACPRQLSFQDIIVTTRSDGEPYGIVLDHTRERKPIPDYLSRIRSRHLQMPEKKKQLENSSLEDLSGQIVPLSISHDGEYATAIALYPGESTFEEFGDAITHINL